MTAAGVTWLHRNLFAKPFDIALSLITIPLLAWVLYSLADWVFLVARWDVLFDSLRVLMIGIYPVDQLWRTWFAVAVLATLFGLGLGLCMRPMAASLITLAILSGAIGVAVEPVFGAFQAALTVGCGWLGLAACLVASRSAKAKRFALPIMLVALVALYLVLAPPGLESWGGLLLSVLLTLAASVLTLPLGILLAFGRQSRIASVRVLSTGYIEIMRSIPLILVVYWIWVVVPLLAPDATVPSFLRGLAGFTLFFAAYVAEYFRSGLQALPPGQVEAARSLGMSTWSVNVDIVLPQALRVVVPSLVGQILDIFNGATLVFIIGLTDFLRAGQMILADPQNSSRIYEIYVFLFAVYFTIGATITYASRRLEAFLARGSR
ncbi:polar amino acid ABC transporter permease [Aliidongia dinghuensis]|uniref:Polar amino acid ABC transporter permease n=2 Tax=Aliidongia dinghuensis TaxID=1867774 RepID=A0A8J2Z1F9_9PROT|nr:polar amino acid ABC transporter permease [Aliidongia dinghuensis]